MFTAEALTKIFVENLEQRKLVLDYFESNKMRFQISSMDDFQRKVLLFDEYISDF